MWNVCKTVRGIVYQWFKINDVIGVCSASANTFALKPISDKARLFRPLLSTLLHVVKNDAVVCWWEHSTRLVVMLQTAVWWSSRFFKMSLFIFDASVAQEQYFCTSVLVFSSTGLAEKRLFGEVNWILQNNLKRPSFGKIKFNKWYFLKNYW